VTTEHFDVHPYPIKNNQSRDLKICSAAVSNRLKPVLVKLISQTQKDVLKGRYIGECTRLIFDLIEKMEEDDIPVISLSFFKAAASNSRTNKNK
jgi:hypothetical protein